MRIRIAAGVAAQVTEGAAGTIAAGAVRTYFPRPGGPWFSRARNAL